MEPIKIPKTGLASILREMAKAVENNDSFEGSISYEICASDHNSKTINMSIYDVTGSFRVGNSEGQGSMRIFGDLT